MECRLESVEIIKVDPKFTPNEFQEFIDKWNNDNPEKSQDASFMPLFSPFIDRCHLFKSEDTSVSKDLLTITMIVSTDNWPGRQEVADITFFVTSLKSNYDHLDVKMMFEVVWA